MTPQPQHLAVLLQTKSVEKQMTCSDRREHHASHHRSLSGPAGLIKRAMDIVVALAVGVALFPAFLLACLAVYIESPGPVIFSQDRIGLHGRKFRCYKIRSMRLNADALWQNFRQANEMVGPIFKMQNDPRILNVGKWIRKFSIDEIPQLYNVMRGEMSMVGPRPPLPAEVAEYRPHHLIRFQVKPGLSGLWQVSGRSSVTNFEDIIALDKRYIRTWSVFLDLAIIFRTILVVTCGKDSG